MKKIRNTTPPKGAMKKFGDKLYYYIGRTLYPSKAMLTRHELQDKGIGVKTVSSRDRGTLIYATKPVYVDLTEPISGRYYNPMKKKAETKKSDTKGKSIYSVFPILPTIGGTFVGWWLGDIIKPPTDTASGGGGVGGLVGGILGFVLGQRIPTARLANPKRKNPGAKWHEDRADELRTRRRRYFMKNDAYSNATWDDINSKVIEEDLAADASRRLGMNPIRTETWRYEASHGNKPRGHGGWWFDIDGHEFQATGTYTEAKAKAHKEARRIGAFYVTVLPNPKRKHRRSK